jgi:hypothetical protein
MKATRYGSTIWTPARRKHADEVAPGSIVLFFLLLSAFIAILTLRAHLLAPVASNAAVAAASAPPIALAAKPSSRRPNF